MVLEHLSFFDQIEWKSGEAYADKSIKRRIPIVNGKEIDFLKVQKVENYLMQVSYNKKI